MPASTGRILVSKKSGEAAAFCASAAGANKAATTRAVPSERIKVINGVRAPNVERDVAPTRAEVGDLDTLIPPDSYKRLYHRQGGLSNGGRQPGCPPGKGVPRTECQWKVPPQRTGTRNSSSARSPSPRLPSPNWPRKTASCTIFVRNLATRNAAAPDPGCTLPPDQLRKDRS